MKPQYYMMIPLFVPYFPVNFTVTNCCFIIIIIIVIIIIIITTTIIINSAIISTIMMTHTQDSIKVLTMEVPSSKWSFQRL